MAANIEKLPKHGGAIRRNRRFAKRVTARLERRIAKRDPEGAPRKRSYAGWAD